MSSEKELRPLVASTDGVQQEFITPQEVTSEAETTQNLTPMKKHQQPISEESEAIAAPKYEADDLTCAICLDQIAVEDICVVKGCEHVYCGNCILAWAIQKEPVWCPQCKAPFATVLTYRKLDGSLSDFPVEESVCLLKRAHWFESHMKEFEKGKAAVNFVAPDLVIDDARDWVDWREDSADYSRFEEQYEDDEEVEAFYFSSAAGRARIVGNRRFGENGFIASGRMQARPVPPTRPSKGKGKAQACSDSVSTPVRGPAEHRACHKTVRGSTRASAEGSLTPASHSKADTPGSSGGKQGRRARRKEKMASADARACLLSSP
ncbi:hypothetical protein WJX75_001177 [Coccomyxa subellipsoidea]|uniref:RING-type domain-containing protein n=1 Tax=Coccomyxa subellipsoidea TaxID=248742 RepID=A0ABR2YI73_9CHLO